MPFNLLLLPLLGGYIFLRYWNPTRYHALRAEKERLVILAAIPGFISLVIAFTIMRAGQYLLPCKPGGYCFQTWWIKTVPFDYVGTAIFALALAGLGWIPLNRIPKCRRDPAISRMIDQDGVALDVLLKNAQAEAKTVAVTMSNGKVYVGFVTHIFNPAFPTRFIKILPTKSGYRDPGNKEYHFTNFYSEALLDVDRDFEAKLDRWAETQVQIEELTESGKKTDLTKTEKLAAEAEALDGELDELAVEAEDFGIVLPVSEIHSANVFSEYIYDKYFARPTASPTSGRKSFDSVITCSSRET